MKSKAHKGKSGGSDPAAGAPTEELPERWSVQRKTELVLRLVRGESLEAVSRENQVPAHELGSGTASSSSRASAGCGPRPSRRSGS